MATKTAQQRVETLSAEREALLSGLQGLEAGQADLSTMLPRLNAAALRGGDPTARDQAETQLSSMVLEISRKQAALSAIDNELSQARQEAAEQEWAHWLQEEEEIRQEAAELADQLDQDLLNRDMWARLWELHRRFGSLRQKIFASENDIPPGARYLSPWHAPDKALAVRLDVIRAVALGRDPDSREARGPRTMRGALGLEDG